MKRHFGFLALFVLATMVVPAAAQPNPLRGAQPDQPVQPQTPVLVPRIRQVPAEQTPAAPQPPKAPFTLTAQEEAKVDQVLKQWEQRNQDTKTFDCDFKRWIYDTVFGSADQAKFIESGVIQYAAPDRGKFFVERAEKDGKESPIDDARADHWICDGKSIFEFSPQKKQVIEHKLPPELQGKAIANSPLPFLFGAEAKNLKERYFIRIITPPNETTQIWLEAYPRLQQGAASFHHAIFVIKSEGMSPHALRLYQPNGKDYTTYQFYNIVVNDPFRPFKGDPFRAHVPLGWQMVPDTAAPNAPPSAASQARRPGDGQR
jgi:TIGR03009 family protein